MTYDISDKFAIDIGEPSKEVHILPPRHEVHGHKIKFFNRSMTVNTVTGEREFSEYETGEIDCGDSLGVAYTLDVLNK